MSCEALGTDTALYSYLYFELFIFNLNRLIHRYKCTSVSERHMPVRVPNLKAIRLVLRRALFTSSWNLQMKWGWLVSKPQGCRVAPSPQCWDHEHMPLHLAFLCPSDWTYVPVLVWQALSTEWLPFLETNCPGHPWSYSIAQTGLGIILLHE